MRRIEAVVGEGWAGGVIRCGDFERAFAPSEMAGHPTVQGVRDQFDDEHSGEPQRRWPVSAQDLARLVLDTAPTAEWEMDSATFYRLQSMALPATAGTPPMDVYRPDAGPYGSFAGHKIGALIADRGAVLRLRWTTPSGRSWLVNYPLPELVAPWT